MKRIISMTSRKIFLSILIDKLLEENVLSRFIEKQFICTYTQKWNDSCFSFSKNKRLNNL